MRRRGLALGLCATLLGLRAAHAEGSSLVTVVRPSHAGEIAFEATTRLAAELRAAGFTVRIIAGAPGVDGRVQVEGERAEGAAKEGAWGDGAFATIAILETSRGAVADVWVADHLTQKTLVRRVDVGAEDTSNAASDLAVRSVELLRASLLEVSSARKQALPADVAQWMDQRPAAPPPPPTPPPAPVARPAAPAPAASAARPRPVPASTAPARAPAQAADAVSGPSVEAAFGVLAGGFGASPRPLLRIAYELPVGLAFRAMLATPVAPNTLSAPAGSVTLWQTVGLLDVAYALRFARSRLYPLFALGAGVYRLRVEGKGNFPYQGKSYDFAAVAITAGGGLGVRLTPKLAARAELDVLAILPEPLVTIAEVEAGRAGLPVFLPSLGLAASF